MFISNDNDYHYIDVTPLFSHTAPIAMTFLDGCVSGGVRHEAQHESACSFESRGTGRWWSAASGVAASSGRDAFWHRTESASWWGAACSICWPCRYSHECVAGDPQSSRLCASTVLIIAHRLSTITQADQIVVLESGRVVEQGRHHALLAKEGRYARIWRHYDATQQWGVNGGRQGEAR